MVDGPTSLSAAGARNAGVERATADVVVFVDADVAVRPDAFTRLRAAFASDPRPRGGLRLLRRQPGRPGHRLRVPQPAPPPRAPVGRGTGRDVLDGAGGRAAVELPGRRGLRRGALPASLDRGHRLRPPAGGDGGPDPPRPRHPGNPPQGVDAALDALDRLRPPRHPVGRPAGAQPAGVERPQLRLAPPPECGGLRRRARVRRSRHGPARARRHGRPARAQPGLLPAPPAPARPRAGRARGGAARVAPRGVGGRRPGGPRRRVGRVGDVGPPATARSSSPPPPAAARWSREQPVRSRSRRLRAPRRGRLRAGAGAGCPASGSSPWPTPIRPAAPRSPGSRPRPGSGPRTATPSSPSPTPRRCWRAPPSTASCWPLPPPPTGATPSGRRPPPYPTLVEKPPAVDAADAAGLAAISPAPWVGFNRRFDPGAAAVRAAVAGRRRRRPAPRDRLPPVGVGRAPRPRRRPPRPRPPPDRLGPVDHGLRRGRRGVRRVHARPGRRST